jgi:tRNA A37 N6-isopentenylltransferase MiaA
MERKLLLNADIQEIIKELTDEEVGAAIKAFLLDTPTQGMVKALANMLKAKERYQPAAKAATNNKKWIYNNVQPILESPFGDGRLHRMCVEYHTQHQNKIDAEVYKEFLSYWTAAVQNGLNAGKERWMCEKTFSLGGRLATWIKNNERWTPAQKEDYLKKTASDLNKLFN